MNRFRIGAVLAALGLAAASLASPVVAQTPETAATSVAQGGDAAVNDVTGKVERAYKTILGRLPEPAGQDYWLGRLAGGMAFDDMLAFFLASPERAIKYPDDQDDGAFLDQLYLDAFGRSPDADGRAYWVGRLGDGLPRLEVIKLFADSPEQRVLTTPVVDFSLNILHINDHHSHLNPGKGDLTLGGESTRVELGGFPKVVTKFNELADSYPAESNVARVHAGDAITGTLFFSLFKGEADAAMMNQICFDAFALGNHEFDGGDEGLVTFLDFLADGDCDTAVIAANVVPEVGTPLAPVSPTDYFTPFVIESYADGDVAFIGMDIASKTQNSSSPLDSTQFLDEVETAQRYIDELTASGIDKIVLVTHYQFDNDILLASMVSGVDVIIGGDSHTLLGDFDDLGLSSQGSYPAETTDLNGLPVCVAQAWQYSSIVGELNVSWDQFGHVAECGGTPHLLLGDSFQRRPEGGGDRAPVTGEALDAIMADIDSLDQVSIVTPDPAALEVLGGFSAQVAELEAIPVATATDNLCLERIPGQGRSTIEGCAAMTAVHGGDIQQLVAAAFRAESFESDIALQNAGGVRIDIPEGAFSIATAYELLPFANTLVNLEMTGQQIKDSVEEGAENAVKPDGSTGAYPYAAGLRWDMDLTQAFGSRVTNLEYQAKDSTEWVAFDLAATYTVVTNSFMAAGGDGYDTMGEIFDSGEVVDTLLDYAKTFIDYAEGLPPVEEGGLPGIAKLPVDQYSTQNFVPLPAGG